MLALVIFLLTDLERFSGMFQHQQEILLTALLEFHKSQCFFATTLQIAALRLFHFGLKENSENSAAISQGTAINQEYVGGPILLAVSMTALLPIIATLSCIRYKGRLSWYTLFLSSTTVILGTATFTAASVTFSKKFNWTFNNQGSREVLETLVLPLKALCGASLRATSDLESPNWVILLISAYAWLLGILQLAKTWQYQIRRSTLMSETLQASHKQTQDPIIPGYFRWSAGLNFLSFAIQLAVFSALMQNHFIPSKWTLGQIIAVVVWVPSFIELIYLEIGERFPKNPFEVNHEVNFNFSRH